MEGVGEQQGDGEAEIGTQGEDPGEAIGIEGEQVREKRAGAAGPANGGWNFCGAGAVGGQVILRP